MNIVSTPASTPYEFISACESDIKHGQATSFKELPLSDPNVSTTYLRSVFSHLPAGMSLNLHHLIIEYLEKPTLKMMEALYAVEKGDAGLNQKEAFESAMAVKLGKEKSQKIAATISHFIENVLPVRFRDHKDPVLFIRSSRLTPRSLLRSADGAVYVLFNKKKQGDPVIGKGSQKSVKLALEYFSCRWFASAGIDNDDKIGNQEVAAMKAVAGIPGFIQMICSVHYKGRYHKNKTRIITPLYEGTLMSVITDPQTTRVQRINITQQLMTSLYHLHKKGIIHRDLKPHNIFVGDDVCIGDVGSVCAYRDALERNIPRTTPFFASPEYAQALLQDKPLAEYVTQKLDVWSLGCILYDLWKEIEPPKHTDLPWVCSTRQETLEELAGLIDSSSHWMKEPHKGTYEHLIWEMTQIDPQNRISIKNLLKALDHLPLS